MGLTSNMMINNIDSAGYVMAEVTDWSEHVKGLLKAELKRRNLGYKELADRLSAMGIPETDRNIANKISRGGFTAAFFVQCLMAIGATTIRLSEPE
jgi:hypothetical protein